ncbi:MAG: VWA domain-containing protein [Gammaproteobacteria bacterium]|nr:VWA domain-containing protein [Gammaproteobacteria bacterium]
MKLSRREPPEIGISFLDTITCGIGAIILLMVITTTAQPEPEAPPVDPNEAEISRLQRELFASRDEVQAAIAKLEARRQALAEKSEEIAVIKRATATTLAQESNRSTAEQEAALNAKIKGELEIAHQRLTDEMQRLYAQRNRSRPDNYIGGIPIDSEYIVFIIDTSGSMFNYAWPKVLEQIVQTLSVYPRVKGLQVMNDEGSYIFPEYAGRWIDDSPARRRAVIDRLRTWNVFSNSSPTEGIVAAIEQFYRPDRKISLYVYGDEFTGRSIREVADFVRRANRPDASGTPLVRIHAIGFPVQFANAPGLQITGIRFAALMRELTRRNGGSFVGLNSFR